MYQRAFSLGLLISEACCNSTASCCDSHEIECDPMSTTLQQEQVHLNPTASSSVCFMTLQLNLSLAYALMLQLAALFIMLYLIRFLLDQSREHLLFFRN